MGLLRRLRWALRGVVMQTPSPWASKADIEAI
jgi:hypothetical protein